MRIRIKSLKGKRLLVPLVLTIVFAVMLGVWFSSGGNAIASPGSEAAIASGALAAQESEPIPLLWYLAPAGSILALLFAFIFYRGMKREPEGTDKMEAIALGVREGANAYLKRQYKVVAIFLVGLACILAYLAFGMKVPVMNPWVPFAFLTGGFFSALCGWLGMKTATYANSRTAQAARGSLNAALKVAFRSGAVMGLVVVGFGLLDICIWFLLLHTFTDYSLNIITVTMLTFGMGASSQALFACWWWNIHQSRRRRLRPGR